MKNNDEDFAPVEPQEEPLKQTGDPLEKHKEPAPEGQVSLVEKLVEHGRQMGF